MTAELSIFAWDSDERHAQNGERVLFVDAHSQREITYGQAQTIYKRIARLLTSHHVKAGDLVASLLPDGLAAATFFLTCGRMGVDHMPLSRQMTTTELERYFRLTSPKALVFWDDGKSHEFLSCVPSSTTLIKIDGTVCEKGDQSEIAFPSRSSRLFVATSGSTGAPKILRLDMDRLWAAAKAFSATHPFLGHDSRFLNFYTFSYLAGTFNLTLIPLSVSGSIVLSEGFKGLSMLTFWSTVRRTRVNTLWFSPTVLHSLDRATRRGEHLCPPEVAAQMHPGFVGMGPLPADQKRRYETKLGFRLLENYGLTETTFIASEVIDNKDPDDDRSCWKILPWVSTEVCETTGELRVKTPFLAEAEIAESPAGARIRSYDSHSFWPTGDICRIKGGGIQLLGRLKNIVKKGGHLISLDEIEHTLWQVPGLAGILSVGLEHPHYGECIALCLARTDESKLSQARKIVVDQLARYKWPSFICVTDAIPQTRSGKTDRRALHEVVARALKHNQLTEF